MTDQPFVPDPRLPAGFGPVGEAGGPFTGAHLNLDFSDPESVRRVVEAQAAALAQQLTPAEVAELRELRAERAEATARAVAEAEANAARLSAPSHYVHLADGQIVEGSQIGTHHTTGDGTGHPAGDSVVKVAAAYEK